MTYEVPTPKVREDTVVATPMMQPTVYLPVSKEMIEKVNLGDVLTLGVRFKVTSVEQREAAASARYELCGEVQAVTMDTENDFEKMSREDEEDDEG